MTYTAKIWKLGDKFTAGDATAMSQQIANVSSVVTIVTPTAVKTAGYTAAVGDLVPCDATGGGFTVTLPTAPADKSVIIVKKVDSSTNTVTVQRGGSDVFNVSGGATSLQLVIQDQTVTLQYKATGAIWYVISHGMAMAGMDTRYQQIDSSGILTNPKASSIKDTNGNTVLLLGATTSAVNYLEVDNAATGGSAVIAKTEGTDSAIDMMLRPKGNATLYVWPTSGVAAQFNGVNSSVNWFSMSPATTTNPPTIRSTGSDTNVGLDLATKNTGVVTANGVPVLTTTGTQTETNKRITPRIGTTTSSATPTINTDNVDQFNITALTVAITSFTTNLSGTPTDGQPLDIRIKGDATPRAITWGASFTGTLLTTTAANKTHLQRLKYDAAAAKWAGYLADTTGY